jgi:hypothetical protein
MDRTDEIPAATEEQERVRRILQQQASSSQPLNQASILELLPALLLWQQQQQQQQQQSLAFSSPSWRSSRTLKRSPRTQTNTPLSSSSSLSSQKRPTEAWARKYTTVDALRENFGGNKNHVWGDLDAASARKLYKTLLPKALLELHQYYSHQLQHAANTDTDTTVATDLAPLAYQARVAAKLYARERCRLPARVAANLYDGFRAWRKYGKFQMQGMSYAQVWEKYSEVIGGSISDNTTEEVISAKIGLKILERACASNPMVDGFVLNDRKHSKGLTPRELEQITEQLEMDVRQLLWPVVLETSVVSTCQASNEPLTVCALRNKQQQTRYRRLRQLARMKQGLDRLSSPFEEQPTTVDVDVVMPQRVTLPDRVWPQRLQ